MVISLLIVIALLLPINVYAENTDLDLSDLEIKKNMIRDSIYLYPGNCPCPYNYDRAGRRCGGRSAWSRQGGAEPYCYPSDISDSIVAGYRAAH